MSKLNQIIKSSSHEKITTVKRRKIIRNSSMGKHCLKSTNVSRVVTQKSHSKNTSYELKPLMKNFNLSLCNKQTSTGNNQLNTKKRLANCLVTPSNSSIKIMLSPKKPVKVEFPLNPRDALLIFSNDLTAYEQAEILDYSDIYFTGSKISKILPKLDQSNFGFDDDRGDLRLFKGDHIAYRYEIISILGKGSFGQVCECYDYKRNEKVAIKIIRNKKKFHIQASIEISILNAIRERDEHDQKPVIKMKNYFLFRKHVCITFDLWSVNLYEVLKISKFQGVSIGLVKRIAKQLLEGLEFFARIEVIHCDLKPENVMLKKENKSDVVIIDLGSATFCEERQHTYIQSRFYRAPEIILGVNYTAAIDMWSLGCVLAELYNGRPLLPGESEHDQLVLIMEIFGMPPASLFSQSTKKDLFFNGKTLRDPTLKNSILKVPGSKKLHEAVCSDDQEFLDFLARCFEIDPALRITPKDALQHPFIKEKHMLNKGNSLSYLDNKSKHLKLKFF